MTGKTIAIQNEGLTMAKKQKELTIIDIHRAFVAQLDINLDKFVGRCQQLDIEDPNAFKDLKTYVIEFVDDVQHYIKNFRMTDGIVNTGNDGKQLLRGNQVYVNEREFFLEHAKQTDPTKKRAFIPYKEYARKVFNENSRREKAGEELLKDIAPVTYESWKSKCK
jgi:hypothetical protein